MTQPPETLEALITDLETLSSKRLYLSQIDNPRDFTLTDFGKALSSPEDAVNELTQRNIELVRRLDEAKAYKQLAEDQQKAIVRLIDELHAANAEADRLRRLLRLAAEPVVPSKPISRWGWLP
jgi:hypothetical protein